MDPQRSLLLNWTYFHQEKSMDELRQSLMLTMELEETRMRAEEELKARDEEISQLKDLLSAAIKERDEAQDKCQQLLFEKLLLRQQLRQLAPLSGASSVEDEHIRANDSTNGFSSSDCDESIVSSPHQSPAPLPELPVVTDRPLPEKGCFLQAVMKAGPLLHTLLLAGPLPQWRHPPPPLDSYNIPPPPMVVPPAPALPTLPAAHTMNPEQFHYINNNNNSINCGTMNRKRVLSDNADSSVELKYQRVALH